jgi:hypothetical protein
VPEALTFLAASRSSLSGAERLVGHRRLSARNLGGDFMGSRILFRRFGNRREKPLFGAFARDGRDL